MCTENVMDKMRDVCVCVCTRKLEPVTVAIEEAMEALASARSPRWPTNMRETSWMPN